MSTSASKRAKNSQAEREEAIANPAAAASIAAKGRKKEPMKSAPSVFLTDEPPIHGVSTALQKK